MLTAHGLTHTKEQWAHALGISTYTIEHGISIGLTMEDVFDLYTARHAGPRTPPPRTPPPAQATPPGPMLESPHGGLTFRTVCGDCAEAARRYYDRRHLEHRLQQHREQAENDLIFQFIDITGGEDSPKAMTQQQNAADHRADVEGQAGQENGDEDGPVVVAQEKPGVQMAVSQVNDARCESRDDA